MPSSCHDFTTRRLRVEHNWNHGNKNNSLAALNLEYNYGTNHHYHPDFSRDSYGGAESHIRRWVYDLQLGTAQKSALHLFHRPTWRDSNPVDNGCFSVKMAGYTAGGGGFTDPIVYLTSDETKPATPYYSTGGQVPSYVTPANNYYVLKHS